jgi:hypothetical protein
MDYATMVTENICKELTIVATGVWECHDGVGHGIIQHFRTIKDKETLMEAIDACGQTGLPRIVRTACGWNILRAQGYLECWNRRRWKFARSPRQIHGPARLILPQSTYFITPVPTSKLSNFACPAIHQFRCSLAAHRSVFLISDAVLERDSGVKDCFLPSGGSVSIRNLSRKE